jgi:hypothetical protein
MRSTRGGPDGSHSRTAPAYRLGRTKRPTAESIDLKRSLATINAAQKDRMKISNPFTKRSFVRGDSFAQILRLILLCASRSAQPENLG